MAKFGGSWNASRKIAVLQSPSPRPGSCELSPIAGDFLLYQDVLDKLEPSAAEEVRGSDRAKWGKIARVKKDMH
jgi:hypothetical protein